MVPVSPMATVRLRPSNSNHPNGSTILRVVEPFFLGQGSFLIHQGVTDSAALSREDDPEWRQFKRMKLEPGRSPPPANVAMRTSKEGRTPIRPAQGRSLFESMGGGNRQTRVFPRGFPITRRIGVRRSLFTGILRFKSMVSLPETLA